MNRNIVIGGIIVVAVAGAFWYGNIVGNSPSAMATSTPDGTTQTGAKPGAPVAVTGTDTGVSDTSAILTGAVTPNGSFTSYWYEYGTSNSLGSKSSSQTIGSGYSVIQAPDYITGLTKDTSYYYRLVAENQYGTVMGSTYSFTTTHNIPAPIGGVPSVQTSVASSIGRTTVDLNGRVSANKTPTNYWFEYGTTANLGWVTSFTSAGNGSGSVAAPDSLSGLTPSTMYYFRLDAQNRFGTVIGTIMSFTTAGPAVSLEPVVTTQVVNVVATTTAILRGTVNPSGLQTTYWFEYGINAGFAPNTLQTTPHNTLAATALTLSAEAAVTGLAAHTTYYYRMVAQNSVGTNRGDSQSFKTN